jgi:hypothetical protein
MDFSWLKDISFQNLLLIISVLSFFILYFSVIGLNIKWGGKTYAIGGVSKKFKRLNEDFYLSIKMKKAIEEVDYLFTSSLQNLINKSDKPLLALLDNSPRCSFLKGEFSRIIKETFYEHIAKNHLRTQLDLLHFKLYKAQLTKELLSKLEYYFTVVPYVAGNPVCGETITDSLKKEIMETAEETVDDFLKKARQELVDHILIKIDKYNEAYKTYEKTNPNWVKNGCTVPKEGNLRYLKMLGYNEMGVYIGG